MLWFFITGSVLLFLGALSPVYGTVNNCIHVNGARSNSFTCRCTLPSSTTSSICSKSTGFYCLATADQSKCHGPPCYNSNGTVINTNPCLCANLPCTTSTGLICYKSGHFKGSKDEKEIGSCRRNNTGTFGFATITEGNCSQISMSSQYGITDADLCGYAAKSMIGGQYKRYVHTMTLTNHDSLSIEQRNHLGTLNADRNYIKGRSFGCHAGSEAVPISERPTGYDLYGFYPVGLSDCSHKNCVCLFAPPCLNSNGGLPNPTACVCGKNTPQKDLGSWIGKFSEQLALCTDTTGFYCNAAGTAGDDGVRLSFCAHNPQCPSTDGSVVYTCTSNTACTNDGSDACMCGSRDMENSHNWIVGGSDFCTENTYCTVISKISSGICNAKKGKALLTGTKLSVNQIRNSDYEKYIVALPCENQDGTKENLYSDGEHRYSACACGDNHSYPLYEACFTSLTYKDVELNTNGTIFVGNGLYCNAEQRNHASGRCRHAKCEDGTGFGSNQDYGEGQLCQCGTEVCGGWFRQLDWYNRMFENDRVPSRIIPTYFDLTEKKNKGYAWAFEPYCIEEWNKCTTYSLAWFLVSIPFDLCFICVACLCIKYPPCYRDIIHPLTKRCCKKWRKKRGGGGGDHSSDSGNPLRISGNGKTNECETELPSVALHQVDT